MIRRFDRQHLTHLGLFLDPPDLGFAWWCVGVENPGRRGLKTCTPLPPIPKERTPPRRCLCLCLYYNLFPARCSRVVRALFVRVRTRCSYAVRALFVRVRVRCSRVVRTLFVRCSYAVRTSSHERELTRELRGAPLWRRVPL